MLMTDQDPKQFHLSLCVLYAGIPSDRLNGKSRDFNKWPDFCIKVIQQEYWMHKSLNDPLSHCKLTIEQCLYFEL